MNRILEVFCLLLCCCSLAGCSRSDNAAVAKARAEVEAAKAEAAAANAELAKLKVGADQSTAPLMYGWDLEITDSTGKVTQLKHAGFRSSLGTFLDGTRYKNVYEGLPVRFETGSTVVNWDLITKAEIDLVRGDNLVPREEYADKPQGLDWRVLLSLKTGELKRASLDMMDELRGKSNLGDYTIHPRQIKKIVVLRRSY